MGLRNGLKLQKELRKELDQEPSLNEPKRVGYRDK